MVSIKIKKNVIFLAYDQGLEHGPTKDFNDKNVDPNYIIDIAKKGKFDGLIVQKGIAEKYSKEIKKSGIDLILKLNGKTSIKKGEPISTQIATVKEAVKLGAKGVGYTIYIGSEHEGEMFSEFEKIQRKAHKKGLFVIAWIYPRGKAVKNDTSKEMMSYATRTGLELGADIVKIKASKNIEHIKWAIKSAGKTKVVIAGGGKLKEKEFLQQIKLEKKAGVYGFALGRNIWQDKDPIKLVNKIRKILK